MHEPQPIHGTYAMDQVNVLPLYKILYTHESKCLKSFLSENGFFASSSLILSNFMEEGLSSKLFQQGMNTYLIQGLVVADVASKGNSEFGGVVG